MPNVLGIEEPMTEFMGKCIAIVHRLDDDDDKLIVVPEVIGLISDEEIENLVRFQEQYFKHVLIR